MTICLYPCIKKESFEVLAYARKLPCVASVRLTSLFYYQDLKKWIRCKRKEFLLPLKLMSCQCFDHYAVPLKI